MNRFSKKYFYYHLFVNLIAPFIVFLSAFEAMPTDEEENILFDDRIALIFLIIGIGVYLLSVLYSYLYYRTSGYEIKEDGITCTRGVLFKKKSFLEYRKIHTIKKRKGIIQQMFGLAYLLVDSGSTNTALSAEVMIIETNEKVDALMEEIKARQNHVSFEKESKVEKSEEKSELLYRFASAKKVKYFLLNLLRCFLLLIIIALLIIGLVGVISAFSASVDSKSRFEIFEMILFLMGIYLACGAVISLCIPFLTYYDFRIYKKGEDIEIDYGLFLKRTNSFQIRRIKGIRIRQGILMRLFGYVSVQLEVIGYLSEGNDAGKGSSDAPFLPLCKADEAENYIRNILPEYLPSKREGTAKSYFAFVAWPLLFTWLPLVLAEILSLAFFLSLNNSIALAVSGAIIGSLAVIVAACILIDSALKYRYESFRIDEDKITLYHGGIFRTCSVVLKKNIIAVQDITTPMRRKRGIYSYSIHFRGNTLRNRAIVEMLDERDREALFNLLTY